MVKFSVKMVKFLVKVIFLAKKKVIFLVDKVIIFLIKKVTFLNTFFYFWSKILGEINGYIFNQRCSFF